MDDEFQKKVINHSRVSQILQKGAEQLHRIFRERWHLLSTLDPAIIEWCDNEVSGKVLIKLCKNAQGNIRKSLETGNVDLWDITITNLAIQAVSATIRTHGSTTDKAEDKLINDLRNLRNKISHGKSELTDAEFEKHWDSASAAVIGLGSDAEDICRLKTMDFGQVKAAPEKKPEFEKLKTEANKLFQDKKYQKAIEFYNQILKLPGLLPENQALIFSNRSASYLLLNTADSIAMAKRDADWAIQLWPCWWRGYFRLGKVHKSLEELNEAEKAFNKALALNRSSQEVRDELSDVRRRIGIISRVEHLNPGQQPKLEEEVLNELFQRTGMNERETKKIRDMVMKDPKYANILKGHQFRDGNGVQQNYEMAAKYYGKSAAMGEPEAMYNLGQLYHHGRGVLRDDKQAMYWLLKAAEAKPITGTQVGSGVPEAQHLLGLKYSEGVGVSIDNAKAAEWYQKAVENGLCNSANNLGLLYKNGQGVQRSLEKAFHYFKLASKWGDTAAMGNLAYSYFHAEGTGSVIATDEDIVEGMRWLKVAAEKGDLWAAQELEERKKQSPTDIKLASAVNMVFPGMKPGADPLDQEQYGGHIKEAANKGSVTAQRHLDIWKCMNLAMDAFKKNEASKMLKFLSEAIRLDFQIVEVPELFKPVIEKQYKANPKDLDTITCYLRLVSKYPLISMPLIVQTLEIYPNDEHLIEILIVIFISLEQYDDAIEMANNFLQICPKSPRIMYPRAIALCLKVETSPECLKALDAFLAIAPYDHDKVPACHYRKAQYYMLKNDMPNMMKCYKAGVAAERKQLPCFLPYDYPSKNALERIYTAMKLMQPTSSKMAATDSAATTSSNTNLEKIKLDPDRKLLLTSHRKLFIQMQEAYDSNKSLTTTTVKDLPNIPKPPRLISLKEITLKEMDSTVDKVYDGYVLEARILEWSYLMSGISTVIEDKNGDVERLAIYKWPSKDDWRRDFDEAIKTFRPNSIISIINPYMRTAKDMKSLIRVQGPEYIRIDYTSEDKKCYICGKEAKILPCSGCLMARYCSKDCQKVDWTLFNHKDVCKHLKKFSTVVKK